MKTTQFPPEITHAIQAILDRLAAEEAAANAERLARHTAAVERHRTEVFARFEEWKAGLREDLKPFAAYCAPGPEAFDSGMYLMIMTIPGLAPVTIRLQKSAGQVDPNFYVHRASRTMEVIDFDADLVAAEVYYRPDFSDWFDDFDKAVVEAIEQAARFQQLSDTLEAERAEFLEKHTKQAAQLEARIEAAEKQDADLVNLLDWIANDPAALALVRAFRDITRERSQLQTLLDTYEAIE